VEKEAARERRWEERVQDRADDERGEWRKEGSREGGGEWRRRRRAEKEDVSGEGGGDQWGRGVEWRRGRREREGSRQMRPMTEKVEQGSRCLWSYRELAARDQNDCVLRLQKSTPTLELSVCSALQVSIPLDAYQSPITEGSSMNESGVETRFGAFQIQSRGWYNR
jgi:hypothetical protein